MGAARIYPHDSEWFDVFQSFAKQAVCVLILPGVTGGLLKELRWIRKNLEPSRVYVLDPVTTDDWSGLSTTMRDAGFEIPAPPSSVGSGGSIVGFTGNWRGYYVGRQLETPAEYAEAVLRSVSPDARPGLGLSEFTGTARTREQVRQTTSYAMGAALGRMIKQFRTLLRVRYGSRP